MRILGMTALLVFPLVAAAGEPFDAGKVQREIGSQPEYNAETPLYALAVFGPQGSTRMWLVLDKSAAGAEGYDLLYADLNGDGNLRADERIAAEGGAFKLPDFTDPDSGATHTEFTLRPLHGDPPSWMISLMWRGERKFGGGYPAEPATGYMQFGTSPRKAPVAWLNADGPFRFQRWYSAEFKIGGASDLKVFIGCPGAGPNSFCAFQQHVLPEDEPVLATLVYRDAEGKQQEVQYELKERC